METLKSLLLKIHNKELTNAEAVAIAEEQGIEPLEVTYTEDGVYLDPRLNADNAPRLLWAGALNKEYTGAEFRAFMKSIKKL